MQYSITGIDVIDSPDSRITMHRLADGSTMPLVLPPVQGNGLTESANHVANIMHSATKAFGELEAVRRTVLKDVNLSEVGRADKLKAPREAAQRALSDAEAQIGQLETATAASIDQALAPPRLETADVEGALIDQEIRAHVRGLSGKDLTDYLQSLKGNNRHLDAILRSPVPIALATDHAKLLRSEAMESNPAVAKAKGYPDAIDWARGTLHTLSRKI